MERTEISEDGTYFDRPVSAASAWHILKLREVLDDVSYTTSRMPALIADICMVNTLLLAQACLFLATWFGISILSLLLLLHFKPPSNESEDRSFLLTPTRISRGSYTSMATPMRVSRSDPTLRLFGRSIQTGSPRKDTSSLPISIPVPISAPVSPAASVVPLDSSACPETSTVNAPVTVSLSSVPKELEVALILRSPVVLCNLLLVTEGARPCNQPETNASPQAMTERVSDPLADYPVTEELFDDFVAESRSYAELVDPIIEEPLTPPALEATIESSDDISIISLKDHLDIPEDDLPGLIEDAGPRISVADSHFTEFQPVHAQAELELKDEASDGTEIIPMGHLSAECSVVTVFTPGRGRAPSIIPIPNVNEVNPPGMSRPLANRTNAPARLDKGKARMRSSTGRDKAVATENEKDTIGGDEATRVLSVNARGKQKAVYKRASWDLSVNDSEEIQQKFMKIVNQRVKISKKTRNGSQSRV